ncbi:MAG: toll/interleukin-1 receptor domain-containing protein [Planctomycetes bacterium]|nr:toll/interleukin-1 receptor domain-containing protein [Planctomycetota bacterium]
MLRVDAWHLSEAHRVHRSTIAIVQRDGAAISHVEDASDPRRALPGSTGRLRDGLLHRHTRPVQRDRDRAGFRGDLQTAHDGVLDIDLLPKVQGADLVRHALEARPSAPVVFERRQALRLELAEALRIRGYRPWLDSERIRTGNDWRIVLGRSILRVGAVVVLLSRAAVASESVQSEAALALDIESESRVGSRSVTMLAARCPAGAIRTRFVTAWLPSISRRATGASRCTRRPRSSPAVAKPSSGCVDTSCVRPSTRTARPGPVTARSVCRFERPWKDVRSWWGASPWS